MAVPLSNLSATFVESTGNTAIKMTIVDTANNVNSNLINFIVNDEVKFRVDTQGDIRANSIILSFPPDTSNVIANTITANTINANVVTSGAFYNMFGSLIGLQKVDVFTANGTWTKSDGVTKVLMFVTGGGGGGDTSTAQVAGAAGATAIKFLDVTTINSANVIIGTGGAAGTTGSNGLESRWESDAITITSGGGQGGNGANTTSLGGTATGGDLNINGGSVSRSASAPSTATPAINGGVSFWGGEGAYGSGGSGENGAGAVPLNANGTDGVVFIINFA